jgi:hypothetical protein
VAVLSQTQEAAWEAFNETQQTFDFIQADVFTGLEELLGALN